MKIVIQGLHCETVASNLIINVIVYCQSTNITLLSWQIANRSSYSNFLVIFQL